MLVLTRKVNEVIAIGDQIVLKVIEVQNGKVRLGIEAPADCRIYREEVYVKIKEQNRQAALWELADFQKAASLFSTAKELRQCR